MTTNQKLLAYTSRMPCKQIVTNGEPYLQRYMAGTTPCKQYDVWPHRWLSCDGDDAMHNHSWNGESVVLCGGLYERIERGIITREAIEDPIKWFLDILHGARHPHAHKITMDTWHQITHVEPETWTLMLVHKDRAEHWHKGDQVIPASPRDWWRGYGCRGENVGDVL